MPYGQNQVHHWRRLWGLSIQSPDLIHKSVDLDLKFFFGFMNEKVRTYAFFPVSLFYLTCVLHRTREN